MLKFSSYSDMELDYIAFGTYKLSSGEIAYKAVSEALENGYSSIDTARYYENEKAVGRAVKNASKKIHITTKIWNNMLGYQKTLDIGRESRDLLGVKSIDLLLAHWPSTDEKNMLETWEALEQLKDEGTTLHIGASNFEIKHLQLLEQKGYNRPESNQIEVNPLHTQEQLRVYCQNNGILVEAWRPLLHGDLHLISNIEPIAKKYNKTTAQICIKWAISSGMRVLVKSMHASRMRENIDVFDFDLTSNEINTIDSLNKNARQGPDPNTFNFE